MVNRISTLGRYQLALDLLGRKTFDYDRQPYQDASLVIRLRDDLMRSTQHVVSHADSRQNVSLWRSLERIQFPVSAFASPATPFFPDRCLGHGCTRWAWNSALALTDEFFQRVGMTAPIDGARPLLIA